MKKKSKKGISSVIAKKKTKQISLRVDATLERMIASHESVSPREHVRRCVFCFQQLLHMVYGKSGDKKDKGVLLEAIREVTQQWIEYKAGATAFQVKSR